MNATSAGVNVKNRNSSSRPLSANLRRPSNSSSVNGAQEETDPERQLRACETPETLGLLA
ncbi:hypothetical protein [Nonomuraea sp. NPDC049400]|uniref:hypothetical protein n=1 Tax=Nonomuraea sp. NPDC049400 TaxID=3364352 RepID=UPI00379232EC